MNPVLILTRNNLDLTKRCVESVRGQDIPTVINIFDNGSTDGTAEWIIAEKIDHTCADRNAGVSAGWNYTLNFLFAFPPVEHVLVLNNDTELPPYFYSKLLSCDLPFVTGISAGADFMNIYPEIRLGPGPDFSAFLIRRSAWELVGPFDEAMKNYASDCDWHIRAHKAGLTLWNSGIPFYHERSSTLNNATPFERSVIERQADADRAEFRRKWGCEVGSKEYGELFK